jgi:NADH-quinone oxidoreductase subunit I
MALDQALLARLNVKPEELLVVRAERGFWQRFYLLEVVLGMAVTLRHLLRNLFHQAGMPTSRFPEVVRALPEGFRGRHRLTKKDDGTPRCVACMMCPTACPADCIHIEAAESPDPSVEKIPVRFDIDLMRCIFCGFCVEACPKDAIRMDTGRFFDLAATRREDFVLTMETLLHD